MLSEFEHFIEVPYNLVSFEIQMSRAEVFNVSIIQCRETILYTKKGIVTIVHVVKIQEQNMFCLVRFCKQSV